MSNYTIKQAKPDDAGTIMRLMDAARRTMQATGNPTQWPNGYPPKETIEDDLEHGDCFLVCDVQGKAVGSFVLRKGPDPSYAHIYDGKWLDNSSPYYVIHRVTSLPTAHGIFAAIIDFCTRHTKNLRIDTHRNNIIMQHLVKKHGFSYCGIIHLDNPEGDERLAYQMVGDEEISRKTAAGDKKTAR